MLKICHCIDLLLVNTLHTKGQYWILILTLTENYGKMLIMFIRWFIIRFLNNNQIDFLIPTW